jgi:polyphosphate kinase
MSHGPDNRLLNRERSFLDYDARMLALAQDPRLPLLERVRFCSIFSQMLDEFFTVRIGGLIGQTRAGTGASATDGCTPAETLRDLRSRVSDLQAEQSRLWSSDLVPALASSGIAVIDVGDLSEHELRTVEQRYRQEIEPVLTPLAVGPGRQPFPYISALSLSLALLVRDPKTREQRFARVKIPEGVPRFVRASDDARFVLLESLITHFLPSLFRGREITECGLFRVTRDADSEVAGETQNLLQAVELELRRRRLGEVTRVEVTNGMSDELRATIIDGLNVDTDLIYVVDGLLDLADVSELMALDRADLKLKPWLPVVRSPLGDDQFAAIRSRPVLVHHPYDSFSASFEAFVDAAADDADVLAIKSTVYRTGDNTPLAPALIRSAENGKQTVCLVEIKARGDESRNIRWGRELERAGVHVVYGLPGIKIHAKTTLVVRREGDELRRYVHIGTGNYNHQTAKLYEDFGLFIADPDIAADVADLFNYLTGFAEPSRFRKLLVAPFNLRDRLVDEIRATADAARRHEPAGIRIKVNGLTHPGVIEELYSAAQVGVSIDLVVRGVCALRPGVRNMSEGIRVRSVLGRFLEHSRVFEFRAGERHSFYIGSADLMARNLEHRIEIVTPVDDASAQRELENALDTLLADTASSWSLDGDGNWQRVVAKSHKRRSAQAVLMRRAERQLTAAHAL